MSGDTLRHVFATFLGIPPDTSTAPVCGAKLSDAYNGRGMPDCPACTAILERWRRERQPVRCACVRCGVVRWLLPADVGALHYTARDGYCCGPSGRFLPAPKGGER